MQFSNYTQEGLRLAFIHYPTDTIVATKNNYLFVSQNDVVVFKLFMSDEMIEFEHIAHTALMKLVEARGVHICREIPFLVLDNDCLEHIHRLCQMYVYPKEQMLYNLTKKYPAMRRLVREVGLRPMS